MARINPADRHRWPEGLLRSEELLRALVQRTRALQAAGLSRQAAAARAAEELAGELPRRSMW